MQHHYFYGTTKFEFCNVKRETQDTSSAREFAAGTNVKAVNVIIIDFILFL